MDEKDDGEDDGADGADGADGLPAPAFRRSNSAPSDSAFRPAASSLSPSSSLAWTANRSVHLPVYPIRGAATRRRPEGDEEGRRARGHCRTLRIPECRPAAVARTIVVAPMARAWDIVPYDRIAPTDRPSAAYESINRRVLLVQTSRHPDTIGGRCIAIGHLRGAIVLFVTQCYLCRRRC